MNHDQRRGDRREAERRKAGDEMDVSRIEHENLTEQVAANLRSLRRLEQEVRSIRSLIEQMNGINQAS